MLSEVVCTSAGQLRAAQSSWTQQQLCARKGCAKQLSGCSHCCFAGYQFAAVGVQNCAINSSSPVNTQFTISFVVYDLNVPSQSATVNRTIVIIPFCPVGQVQCVDGTCNTVPICALRSAEIPLCCHCRSMSVSRQPAATSCTCRCIVHVRQHSRRCPSQSSKHQAAQPSQETP